ncbi:hypothetical protein Tco_1219289 [Tanacetum coccineum]
MRPLFILMGFTTRTITVELSLGINCQFCVIPRTVPFVGLLLRCCCARTELITPDLICPSTYQLLLNSGGDSGPDLSFDKSASSERLFSSTRVSLAEAAKPDLSFGCSEGDYTSSCPPSLGPLLSVRSSRVITFEVLCRSLQIEPTVTLFRVFQTLCKQGDWFHFAKRRAPSPVCIDDNRSCMKHWKSGFCFIDRRAILDAMVWRHLDAAIDNPRHACLVLLIWLMCTVAWGADGNVMGIHDFLCLPEWTGVEVQEEPYLDVRPTLQRLLFYCTPPATADAVIPDPTPEDLAVGTIIMKNIYGNQYYHGEQLNASLMELLEQILSAIVGYRGICGG